MTNYRQQLNTAKEAKAWAEAHPDGVLKDRFGTHTPAQMLIETELSIFPHPPYTVLKTGNTITIDGATYREGNNLFLCEQSIEIDKLPDGLIFQKLYDDWCKLLHIPDEVADKREPKEPQTVTLDEICRWEEPRVYLIDPLKGGIFMFQPMGYTDHCALEHHVDKGRKLYRTRQDAKLGKARGWK